MIYIKDAKIYAKVWEVNAQEKVTTLKVSTSDKDKDGNKTYSSWYPVAFGQTAKRLAEEVRSGDTIIIKTAKLKNELYMPKDGDKKKTRFEFVIFDYEALNNDQPSAKNDSKANDEPADDSSPW
jgi:single-stranded DNA-binding protein